MTALTCCLSRPGSCLIALTLEKSLQTLIELKALLERGSIPQNEIKRMRGEVYALRSQQFYWQADSRWSLYFARLSLEDTPVEDSAVRGLAWRSLASALQMQGDLNGAFAALFEGLHECKYHTDTFPANIFIALSLIQWMEADPLALIQTAEYLLKLGRERNLPESVMWANYFLGYAYYETNNLEAAETHFSSVVKQGYIANNFPYSQSIFGLAATYYARESTDRAYSVIDSAKILAYELNNTQMLVETQAFEARLMMLQGNKFEAQRWTSRNNQPWRLPPLPTLFPIPITLVLTLLEQETPASLNHASQIIDSLQDSVRSIHNTRYLIMVLALKALVQDACHNEAGTLAALEEAVTLAQAGGVVRVFVDLGKRMATLINRLPKKDGIANHINVILQAFQMQEPDLHNLGNVQLTEPLTNRELEILTLLAQRLSNKEIAQELVISPLTVKRHNINIYQKLNANNRREAVVAASNLGLVPIQNLAAYSSRRMGLPVNSLTR